MSYSFFEYCDSISICIWNRFTGDPFIFIFNTIYGDPTTSGVKAEDAIQMTSFWPSWRLHQMKPFFALLALCAENSPVTSEFPSQRPVTRSFDAFFDLFLDKRLSKQSRRRWFKVWSRSLWRHCSNISVFALERFVQAARVMHGNHQEIIFFIIYVDWSLTGSSHQINQPIFMVKSNSKSTVPKPTHF